MQLPAQQTSLEPHPHREDPAGRRPFLSQNTYTGDGSRLASDPGRVQRPRISDPQTPKVDLNKLPIIGWVSASSSRATTRRGIGSLCRQDRNVCVHCKCRPHARHPFEPVFAAAIELQA
jgi:hypothetical protein